jgi:hypothetical protein
VSFIGSPTVASRYDAVKILRREGTHRAEPNEKYFCQIKFSTQVLISVWKIGSRSLLTALSSTACSCLHNFSAAKFLHHGGLAWSTGNETKVQNKQNQIAARLERGNSCDMTLFYLNFSMRKNS